MHKQNAKLWTAVAGLVFACPSLVCLYTGVGILIGQGSYTPDANTMAGQTISPILGLPLLCLGLLPWALPFGVWRYASKRPAPPAADEARSRSLSEGYSPFSVDPYHDADANMSSMDSDT